jgi:hypothetical protein
MFHLTTWQDHAGLIIGLLIMAVSAAGLILLMLGVGRAAAKPTPRPNESFADYRARVLNGELTYMIKDAQAYESEQDRLRRIAEWEALK